MGLVLVSRAAIVSAVKESFTAFRSLGVAFSGLSKSFWIAKSTDGFFKVSKARRVLEVEHL